MGQPGPACLAVRPTHTAAASPQSSAAVHVLVPHHLAARPTTVTHQTWHAPATWSQPLGCSEWPGAGPCAHPGPARLAARPSHTAAASPLSSAAHRPAPLVRAPRSRSASLTGSIRFTHKLHILLLIQQLHCLQTEQPSCLYRSYIYSNIYTVLLAFYRNTVFCEGSEIIIQFRIIISANISLRGGPKN